MKRAVAILSIGFVLSVGQSVDAAPPSLRPIDVETVYAFSEAARAVSRELEQPRASDLMIGTIVLDPGHGGSNEGALGVAEVEEKRLTLDLAYALREELERRHPQVTVLLTRYWDRDVSLPDRIGWANEVGADLFISLHYNAATHDRAIGFETYFLAADVLRADGAAERPRRRGTAAQRRAGRAIDTARFDGLRAARTPLLEPHEESQRLAAIVQGELVTQLDESVNRGVKAANFAVLRGALMPAVVVESGFLTHPVEGRAVLSPDHRRRVVAALASAIEKFAVASPPATTSAPVAHAH